MTTTLEPLALGAAEFAPFGHVLEQPAEAADAQGPGWRWWGETMLVPASERPYGVGYLRLEAAAPRFDWAERHMRSVEVIVPAGGDVLVYVAPPEHLDEPSRPPAPESFRVFRVRQEQGVVLARGVWHGAPLAAGGPTAAFVLLLERTGSEDTVVTRFEEMPIEIAIERGDVHHASR